MCSGRLIPLQWCGRIRTAHTPTRHDIVGHASAVLSASERIWSGNASTISSSLTGPHSCKTCRRRGCLLVHGCTWHMNDKWGELGAWREFARGTTQRCGNACGAPLGSGRLLHGLVGPIVCEQCIKAPVGVSKVGCAVVGWRADSVSQTASQA